MHKRHRKGSRTTRHSRAFQTKRTVSLMMASWIPVACCAHLDLEFLRSGLMLSHGHSVQYTGSLLVTPRFSVTSCAGAQRRCRASQTMCKTLLLNFFWSVACTCWSHRDLEFPGSSLVPNKGLPFTPQIRWRQEGLTPLDKATISTLL